MEKYIDNLLRECSKDELLLIKSEISNMSHEDLIDSIDTAISFREDIMNKSYNKQVNLLEDNTIPDSVRRYLKNNNITTMADLLESGIEDTRYTDHWIEWIKTYLDMNKTMENYNRNKLK